MGIAVEVLCPERQAGFWKASGFEAVTSYGDKASARELAGRDAFVLYQQLCARTGKRQDPCVLDTFMAATDFMRGADPRPWWAYTAERKAVYGSI